MICAFAHHVCVVTDGARGRKGRLSQVKRLISSANAFIRLDLMETNSLYVMSIAVKCLLNDARFSTVNGFPHPMEGENKTGGKFEFRCPQAINCERIASSDANKIALLGRIWKPKLVTR